MSKKTIYFKIRKFASKLSVFSSVYWKFFYCPAALQMDLDNLEDPGTFDGLEMKPLTIDSPLFEEYVNFINTSYEEKIYTKNQLAELLTHHHYLTGIITYVLVDSNNHIVATISAGKYEDNHLWGGAFKFATDKSSRNKGIGLYMLRYGYYSLKERGCRYGESIVSDRKSRVASLMTHFKCGFVPQTNRDKIQFSVCRGKYNKLKSLFTNRWAMKYYRLYLKTHTINK